MRPKVLLVDGHSMIFALADLSEHHARNTAAAREELVRELTPLQDVGGWSVAVVFDGKGSRASDASEPGGIAVFYSAAGQTADALIERLAAKYAQTCDVTAATDDNMVRTTVASFGGTAISSMQLVSEIRRAREELGRTIRKLGKTGRA